MEAMTYIVYPTGTIEEAKMSQINVALSKQLSKDSKPTMAFAATIWLILPELMCSFQRLSHACISINALEHETANGSLERLQFT